MLEDGLQLIGGYQNPRIEQDLRHLPTPVEAPPDRWLDGGAGQIAGDGVLAGGQPELDMGNFDGSRAQLPLEVTKQLIGEFLPIDRRSRGQSQVGVQES
jgi:hypothetical protein